MRFLRGKKVELRYAALGGFLALMVGWWFVVDSNTFVRIDVNRSSVYTDGSVAFFREPLYPVLMRGYSEIDRADGYQCYNPGNPFTAVLNTNNKSKVVTAHLNGWATDCLQEGSTYRLVIEVWPWRNHTIEIPISRNGNQHEQKETEEKSQGTKG